MFTIAGMSIGAVTTKIFQVYIAARYGVFVYKVVKGKLVKQKDVKQENLESKKVME